MEVKYLVLISTLFIAIIVSIIGINMYYSGGQKETTTTSSIVTSPETSPTTPTTTTSTSISTPASTSPSTSTETETESLSPTSSISTTTVTTPLYLLPINESCIYIPDYALLLTTQYQSINETYVIVWMTVTLQFSIKNICNETIFIRNITVDDLPLLGFTPVNIGFNQTYVGVYPVVLDPENQSTRIIYDPMWEAGTVHEVKIYYEVIGENKIYTVKFLATVT